MSKHRIISFFLIIGALIVGYFVYSSQINPESKYAFKLGLDLDGGTQLIYKADTSQTDDVSGAMASLRDVIERRVNLFGVSEPVVQVEEANILSGTADHRLIVELPGVTDIDEAVRLIGETPQLEFALLRPEAKDFSQEELETKPFGEIFSQTGLTGRYLERAQLQFTQQGGAQMAGQPIVLLTFDSEGKDLFAKITRENTGEILAIFLDGVPISTPVINEEISDGQAVISGNFTPDEAKALVRDLNYGALPLPVELISTQTVGASLGENAQTAGVRAGLIGFITLIVFIVLWYRIPGLVAALSLLVYIAISLALFKLIPVTLTAAGIAGFILSIGMAVGANIFIF